MKSFNESFTFFMPTRVEFGIGKIVDIGKEVADFGKKPLVVFDKTIQSLPFFEKIIKSLKKDGLDPIIFDQIVPNSRDSDVYDGVKLYKKEKCDFLIAVGGGSTIDSAKAIGAVVSGNLTINELESKGINNPLPYLVVVPTTSGSGSEVTPYSIITDVKKHNKMTLADRKLIPILSIMDPEITLSLPPEHTAGTGNDALTHAIESYSCTLSTPLIDGIALYAIELIAKYLKKAVSNGSNLEARAGMMLGSLMAGVAFHNTGLGAVHSIGEVIGGIFDIPHGISMAIFLPYVLDYNKDADPKKHAKIAQALGVDVHGLLDIEAATNGVKFIKELNRGINIPSLSSLNVDPDSFSSMADLCMKHVCTPFNAKPINREIYEEIYKKAYKAK